MLTVCIDDRFVFIMLIYVESKLHLIMLTINVSERTHPPNLECTYAGSRTHSDNVDYTSYFESRLTLTLLTVEELCWEQTHPHNDDCILRADSPSLCWLYVESRLTLIMLTVCWEQTHPHYVDCMLRADSTIVFVVHAVAAWDGRSLAAPPADCWNRNNGPLT